MVGAQDRLVQNRQRRAHGFHVHHRRQIGDFQQLFGFMPGFERQGCGVLGAVDEHQPFFRAQRQRFHAQLGQRFRCVDALEACAACQRAGAEAFAQHDHDRVGRGREVAGRAHAATRGHAAQHAGSQQAQEEFDRGGADAAMAPADGVQAQQPHGQHDVAGGFLADAAGVGADQVGLQLFQLAGRNPPFGKMAEAGVHAINRLVGLAHFRHRVGAGLHARQRRGREMDCPAGGRVQGGLGQGPQRLRVQGTAIQGQGEGPGRVGVAHVAA